MKLLEDNYTNTVCAIMAYLLHLKTLKLTLQVTQYHK